MPHKSLRTFFLTVFSGQGGIERFNRAILLALQRVNTSNNFHLTASVVYDETPTNQNYFPASQIQTYRGNKLFFLLREALRIFKKEVWIIGHLNLAPLGILRKKIFPSQPLILICHGIEVFSPLKGVKRRLLHKADKILAVSQYTKDQLIQLQHVPEHRIDVFPNTLDPFFKLPTSFEKPDYLLTRYAIDQHVKILFTLSRMNAEEGYKGYDQVIKIIPSLLKEGIQVKYILAGKADDGEKRRIKELIHELHLESHVCLAGFIKEEEIIDHYLLSDLFVMPSKGEGFGIVYLEALACGVPVIAGNKDGSTEALQYGKLGKLVNPDDKEEILEAVKELLENRPDSTVLQKEMLSFFSFNQFLLRTESLLHSLN
jgi:glycosyltransferase involved in cell wall biosynthesis